jgi:hypothetical protein
MGTSVGDYSITVQRLRAAASVASAGAAAIHLGTAPAHMAEWLPAGCFMLMTGIAQLAWSILIGRRRCTSASLAAGLAGNVALVALWAMSRTIGLPFGPMPFTPEHVHGPDLLAVALEVIVVGTAVALLDPFLPRPGRALLGLAWIGAALCPLVAGDDPARERIIAGVTLLFVGRIRVALRAQGADGRKDARTVDIACRDLGALARHRAVLGARG